MAITRDRNARVKRGHDAGVHKICVPQQRILAGARIQMKSLGYGVRITVGSIGDARLCARWLLHRNLQSHDRRGRHVLRLFALRVK